MSYLALARKWRPTTFSEVVGQSHVLTALENALDQNRLHHAYLFSGTRGVGKTTIGRLLAKGLNCETGITSHPCGQCQTCREIDQGRFVDLLEIDAASRTKVEDTRELLDNVQYKPARGRFKVYLIDEVHMLSRHSFNALLKTLEEPPEYVKFLLATTDPQKLPVTILSRCLQFHLKPISVENIEQQLAHIFDEESVSFEPRAVSLLAHAADGSMRDALSLSDQAIALGNGQVNIEQVSHMLGTIDNDQALHILNAISHNDPQVIMDQVESLALNGVDWDSLLKSLCEQLHRLAMYQVLPASVDKSSPDGEKIRLLAQAISPEEVQLYYQIALKGRQDIPLSPTPRIGLEMVLLRMVAFRPVPASPLRSIEKPSSIHPSDSHIEQSASRVAKPEQQRKPETSRPSESTQTHSIPVYDTQRTPVQQVEAQNRPTVTEPPQTPAMVDPESKPATAHSSISGLRHQLRSQRNSNSSEGNSSGKKPKAASQEESVFDRLANIATQHNVDMPRPSVPQTEANDDISSDEAYRWMPMFEDEISEKEINQPLSPSELKQAVEHEKTPEMAAKLIEEVNAKDEWSRLIQSMQIPKLVEQLALNSAYQKQGNSVNLTLRANQQHLNTEKAYGELQQAISQAIGESCQLNISIGDIGQTPLELRELCYQEHLHQAYQSLQQDKIVQFIEKRFGAELDKDTIRPI
ncbi:DNA polymerase III subunit gamma/tau [Vibrio viridaestus]|uniref:DNA polymerase III subunit gamma/tau n=1 Tax=Vibrio viridaestus TaxID=2487322 RepID=A0A3N9U199_9VIBR|nr:DNA polymerase III subunit gamma/tau [Vibrio viridaestus]RQW63162.1 DNA polymerase III subunit gamma/tau [Vibrio viridaestus]